MSSEVNKENLGQAVERRIELEKELSEVKDDITFYLVNEGMSEFFQINWRKLENSFGLTVRERELRRQAKG